ncbi:MAG: type 2 periplasmic-binding domain-containing protein [Acidiferrobacter sp.]
MLGILITTFAFAVASWRGLEQATRHRLAIIAAAIGRVEESYLTHIASDMQRLQTTLRQVPPAPRARLLRDYVADHPKDVDAAILNARDHILAAASPLEITTANLQHTLLAVTSLCLSRHHLCFSPPFATPHGRRVLFAQSYSSHDTLILERPLSSWPRLRGLVDKLPPHFHIFIVNRGGGARIPASRPGRYPIREAAPRPSHAGAAPSAPPGPWGILRANTDGLAPRGLPIYSLWSRGRREPAHEEPDRDFRA